MKSVLINEREGQTIVCVLDNGKIVERYIFKQDEEKLSGNIYLGKVEEVVDGMQAAFVDIGLDKKAFISLKDAMPKIDIIKESYVEDKKISDVLKNGQSLLVQIKKESSKEKGARISTHITLSGKYIVLMPDTNIITISQKIEDENEKIRLKELIKRILPENFGAIIRTEAIYMNDNLIKNDIENILNVWFDIKNEYQKDSKVRKIYSGYEIVDFVLKDLMDRNTNKVYVNSKNIYKQFVDKNINNIEIYETQDLLEKFGLITEYSKIDDRKIWLKCGGQIVIDKTEALTAIDVNSQKFTGKADLESTVFRVNQEAAIEIMKQLRLKNIGGMILIDFIDMKNEIHKSEILETLKLEARKDRSKVNIYDFTKLNLVELTRKKLV